MISGGRYVIRYVSEQLHKFQEKETADCLEHARYFDDI